MPVLNVQNYRKQPTLYLHLPETPALYASPSASEYGPNHTNGDTWRSGCCLYLWYPPIQSRERLHGHMVHVSCYSISLWERGRLTRRCRPGGIPHRKHPDLFRSLRETTVMLGPCCLCPLLDESGPDYVEAAMYMATVGPYAGQYVIGCANDQCGYLGQSKMRSAKGLNTVYSRFFQCFQSIFMIGQAFI